MEAFLLTGCAKSCSVADAGQVRTMMGETLGCGAMATMTTWEGTASLASTGNWSFQVAIGQEQCGELTTTLRAVCMASFIDTSGRCDCPLGHLNVNGKCEALQSEADPCQLVNVSGNLVERDGTSATVRPGTVLSVSFPPGIAQAASYNTVIVPTQGAETRNATEPVLFRSTGSYALHLQYLAMSASGASERQCTILRHVEVRCAEMEEQVDGQCRPRQQCRDEVGFDWLDIKANACKKRPEMALKTASDKLSITLIKTNSTPVYCTTVEVRLASGAVDGVSTVEWTASSSVGWLRLGQRNGTANSNAPVGEVSVLMDSRGLNDTGVTSPLRANITVVSRMAGRSDLFEKGTHLLTMEVQLSVLAVACMTLADLRIQRSSGEDLMDGASVVAGDTLIISANAFDYERLPIPRAGLQLTVRLTSDRGLSKFLEMQYREGNTYRGEVPSSWLVIEGSYRLRIGDTREVEIRFEVSKSNRSLYIGAGISSVGPQSSPSISLRPIALCIRALV
jgi:hypothetical protein